MMNGTGSETYLINSVATLPLLNESSDRAVLLAVQKYCTTQNCFHKVKLGKQVNAFYSRTKDMVQAEAKKSSPSSEQVFTILANFLLLLNNASGKSLEKLTVICYDRLISGTDDVDYFVTFDSYEIGKAQGQYLLEKYAGKKDVPLYLYAGNAEDENSFLLFAGAWSVLSNAVKGGQFSIQNCPAVASFAGKELDIVKNRADLEKILRTINTKWNSDEAAKLAAANLKGKKKGDVAILAPNDETARSIAATFKADKDVKSYVITGQDADLASLKAIHESRQTMTIRKDTGELADVTCNMVKKILEGGKVETTSEYDNGVKKVPAVGAGFAVVDAANLPDLISEGVFSQDEIDDAK